MGAEGLNEELFEEYDVITIEMNGKDVEFAIVDEFDQNKLKDAMEATVNN